jgi:hypothetical protein
MQSEGKRLLSVLMQLTVVLGFLGLSSARASAQSSWVISGSPDGTANFGVDDRLVIYINGKVAYDDGPTTGSGQRHYIPFPELRPGDVMGFEVYDTYGYCSALNPLYLTCSPGGGVLAATGFNQGCGHPGGNRGLQ